MYSDRAFRGRETGSLRLGTLGIPVTCLIGVLVMSGSALAQPSTLIPIYDFTETTLSSSNNPLVPTFHGKMLGDVDGDGFSDWVTVEPYFGVPGSSSGRVIVFSGRTRRPLYRKSGSTAGTGPITGAAPIGDINRDQLPDLAILSRGQINLYAGDTGKYFATINSTMVPLPAALKIRSAGDVDNDGLDDLLIFGGSPATGVGTPANGGFEVFSAANLGLLLRVMVQLQHAGPAGDIDNDGFDDIIVGNPWWGAAGGGTPAAGRGDTTIYSGATGSIIHYIQGTVATGQQGAIAAGVGDLDGDGFDDFASTNAGTPPPGFQHHTMDFYSGRTGLLLFRQKDDRLFLSVAAAGDVDFDQHDDIQLLLQKDDTSYLEIRSGEDGKLLYAYEFADVGFMPNPSIYLNAPKGDVNGDGFKDFIFYNGWNREFKILTGLPIAGPAVSVGAGCGAQAPYPSLNLSAVPSTGATFDMLVSGAPPFSQATALLSHLPENAPVQLSNNCLGYLSPAAGTLGTFSIDASGNGVLPVPIPNIPGLAGMELSVQVFFDTPLPTATQAYNFRVTQ